MGAIRINFLLWMLLFCWFQPGGLAAQALKCDAVRPLPGSLSSYQKRENRCEGLYVADVGSRSIDVVSFTSGKLIYDLESRLPLRVSVSSQARSVNVRAVAIPRQTYYRMDAVLHRGAVLVWPVTDVLLRENLTDNLIGIFGWAGAENAKTFVPVRVVTDRPARASPERNQILLSIQLSFEAETIKWRWAAAQPNGCRAFGAWRNAIEQKVRAGWPVKINVRELPRGFACVEIAARSRISIEWVTLKIRIEMPAQ